jgi:hypothetical protein
MDSAALLSDIRESLAELSTADAPVLSKEDALHRFDRILVEGDSSMVRGRSGPCPGRDSVTGQVAEIASPRTAAPGELMPQQASGCSRVATALSWRCPPHHP